MLRLAISIVGLWPAFAWAEGMESAPTELQWLKGAADIISTIGMPGVIVGLIYLLRLQKKDRDKELAALDGELAEERAYNRKVQEDRIVSAAASADRLATVATSSSNAIATAAEKNAGLMTLVQDIKEGVMPIDGEHKRIIQNQADLFKDLSDIKGKIGSGCRAP